MFIFVKFINHDVALGDAQIRSNFARPCILIALLLLLYCTTVLCTGTTTVTITSTIITTTTTSTSTINVVIQRGGAD